MATGPHRRGQRFIELGDKTADIFPTHGFNRSFATLEATGILSGHRLPQGLGTNGLGQPKALGQQNLMLGFIIETFTLILR
jgi:hypothetical protein